MIISADTLKKIMPRCPPDKLTLYSQLLIKLIEQYCLNTLYRRAYFLGQIAWESGDLRFMREIWDPDKVPQQLRYNRSFDFAWPPTATDKNNRLAYKLGNDTPGAGYDYRGFGPLQVTGKYNVGKVSDYMYGDDRLVVYPTLLDDPEVGFGAAFWYWNDRKLNEKADAKDYKGTTLLINGACTDGPPSHYIKRVECLDRALAALAW